MIFLDLPKINWNSEVLKRRNRIIDNYTSIDYLPLTFSEVFSY